MSSSAIAVNSSGNVSTAALRRIIVEQSYRAGVGHIGSALSIVEIVCALYGAVMRMAHPADPARDRFILSKGHAALALYGALHLRGWIDESLLSTYSTGLTRLGAHPDHALPGVEFSTGSLGLGLSFGTGAAFAARLAGRDCRVFALLSDAECNEGSVWEAAMFAAHHRLGRLVAIVDANGQQALGSTSEILNMEPLGKRWDAFGWDVKEVDGHDVGALVSALDVPSDADVPRVVIARTTFGRGVSFMERKLAWHYMPLTEPQFQQAIAELEGAYR